MNEREQIIASLIAALQGENPDSFEFGSASKGGAFKVYGSFSRPQEFQEKVNKAFELRKYAQQKAIGENNE